MTPPPMKYTRIQHCTSVPPAGEMMRTLGGTTTLWTAVTSFRRTPHAVVAYDRTAMPWTFRRVYGESSDVMPVTVARSSDDRNARRYLGVGDGETIAAPSRDRGQFVSRAACTRDGPARWRSKFCRRGADDGQSPPKREHGTSYTSGGDPAARPTDRLNTRKPPSPGGQEDDEDGKPFVPLRFCRDRLRAGRTNACSPSLRDP